MEPKCVVWSKHMEDAKSGKRLTMLCKQGTELKKEMKQDRVNAFFAIIGNTKKFITTELKKGQAALNISGPADLVETDTTPAPPSVAVMQAMVAALTEKDMLSTFVSRSVFEAKSGIKASLITSNGKVDPVRDLMAMQPVKKAIKDVKAHMVSSGSYCSHHCFSQVSPEGKKVNRILNKALSADVRTKFVLPDQDEYNKVFSPDLLIEKNPSCLVGPTNYCLCEARLILEAGSTLYGLPYGSVPGTSAADKRAFLSRMTTDDAVKYLEDSHGWCIVAKPGDIVVMPAGHFIMSTTSGTTAISVRWAVGGDSVDLSSSREMLYEMLTSFKELKAPTHGYLQLHEWLVDQGF